MQPKSPLGNVTQRLTALERDGDETTIEHENLKDRVEKLEKQVKKLKKKC